MISRARRLSALYSSLSRAFLPKTVYGADWDGESLRIVALENRAGLKVVETFAGNNPEQAAAFAHARGLAFEGLHLSFHEPYVQFSRLGSGDDADDELESKAEKTLPLGLRLEQVEQRIFQVGSSSFAATVPHDALEKLNAEFAPALRAWWSASPGPLALLPWLARESMPADFVALWPMRSETQALFFRDGNLFAVERLAVGLKEAESRPERIAQDIRKALAWWESLHPEHAIGVFQVWRDTPGSSLAEAVEAMGFAIQAPSFPELPALPSEFRLAGAMALAALRNQTAPANFGPLHVEKPKAGLAWHRRSGHLAAAGFAASLIAGALLFLSATVALGFSFWVGRQEKQYAGELEKWEALRGARAAVETRLAALGGLPEKGNDASGGMAALASLLPDELWLQGWEMRAGEGGRFQHVVTGCALAEARVAEFMAKLEQSRRFRMVRLRSTEKIAGEKVEEKTGLRANRRELVRFEAVAEE